MTEEDKNEQEFINRLKNLNKPSGKFLLGPNIFNKNKIGYKCKDLDDNEVSPRVKWVLDNLRNPNLASNPYDSVSNLEIQKSDNEDIEMIKLRKKITKDIFRYDVEECTINLGEFKVKINYAGNVHRCLCIMSQSKTNLRKKWDFDELAHQIDRELETNKNTYKKMYQNFKYVSNKLPMQISDLFILKANFVQINRKYIKMKA